MPKEQPSLKTRIFESLLNLVATLLGKLLLRQGMPEPVKRLVKTVQQKAEGESSQTHAASVNQKARKAGKNANPKTR